MISWQATFCSLPRWSPRIPWPGGCSPFGFCVSCGTCPLIPVPGLGRGSGSCSRCFVLGGGRFFPLFGLWVLGPTTLYYGAMHFLVAAFRACIRVFPTFGLISFAWAFSFSPLHRVVSLFGDQGLFCLDCFLLLCGAMWYLRL